MRYEIYNVFHRFFIFSFCFFMKKRNSITVAVLDLKFWVFFRVSAQAYNSYVNSFTSSCKLHISPIMQVIMTQYHACTLYGSAGVNELAWKLCFLPGKISSLIFSLSHKYVHVNVDVYVHWYTCRCWLKK